MAEKKSKPKQKDLPGMEARKLPELHAAAESYAEVRDERMELTKQEVVLKKKLVDLMHKHDKKQYKFENVSILLVIEEETVRVRIRKPKDGE